MQNAFLGRLVSANLRSNQFKVHGQRLAAPVRAWDPMSFPSKTAAVGAI
jgi:hypothetical protein